MIIKEITLKNYGVYAGEHTFDLTPRSLDSFNHPIILLQGKNGSGKTTFFRAIRMALHGSLALGTRVSQTDYDAFLASVISQTSDYTGQNPQQAGISLIFDFVKLGKKTTFEVKRTWERSGEKIIKNLNILENGINLDHLDDRQKEDYLRDLITPGVVDIFFFDGEKMKLLAESDSDQTLLASSLRSLFGLNLVHRLQQDVDIYITRKEDNNGQGILQEKIKQLSVNGAQKESERCNIEDSLKQVRESIDTLEDEIYQKELSLASQGNSLARKVVILNDEKQKLKTKIEDLRRDAVEQCSGLLPFCLANDLCKSLSDTLITEEHQQNQQTAETIIKEKIFDTIQPLLLEDFWQDFGLSLSDSARAAITKYISGHLQKSLISNDGQHTHSTIHHLSKRDRTKLLGWIDRTLNETPSQFHKTINQLNGIENRMNEINQQLSLVPADEIIAPLINEISKLNQELGALRQKESRLNDDWQRITNSLDMMERQLIKVRSDIAAIGTTDQRIRLAARTQGVLKKYENALLLTKIKNLETSLHTHFNTLCRKEDLVNAVNISPDTFEITLVRHNLEFSRSKLSTGENQVLATALMWALRDISGIPIPIIIDTPLSRLDNDHRNNMVQHFFPYASHQIILLTTDTETPKEMLNHLQPFISHVYLLNYDEAQGKTNISKIESEVL